MQSPFAPLRLGGWLMLENVTKTAKMASKAQFWRVRHTTFRVGRSEVVTKADKIYRYWPDMTIADHIQASVDGQRPGLVIDEFLHNCSNPPCSETLEYTDRYRETVEAIRDSLPESPALAVWAASTHINRTLADDKYLRAANDFFYDKSPSAALTSPADAQTVGCTVAITAQATPNATTQEAISSYRFFIDNECVYVGNQATYQWDANAWTEGTHTVTAHAVDAKWLVGVAQVEVTVAHDATVAPRPHLPHLPHGARQADNVEFFDLCCRKARVTNEARARVSMRTGAYVLRPKNPSHRPRMRVMCER